MIKRIEYPLKNSWKALLQRPVIDRSVIEERVNKVLQMVKHGGDKAVLELTAQFDQVQLSSLTVSPEEFIEAENLVSNELKDAIEKARLNIEKFHLAQREDFKKVETTEGVTCWRKSVPIGKVGLYIPGGTAPLFSTILMLGVPANIAGCEEIILCTPPNKEGKIHPAILHTAASLGIHKVYKAGGAQAIAAMAYGTETISSVYKIFGPGNQYVTCAKQLVFKDGVSIDMPAGPSEVAVLASDGGIPEFIAADLLSQAEHGPDSQVVLVSDKAELIDETEKALEAQLKELPRAAFAEKALLNSKAILVRDLNEAMDLLNEYAPEHLILQMSEPEKVIASVKNAGSVFMGIYTPESAGDYASGTNHTLPTNGYATAYSGVSLDSFIKKITFQHITKSGLKNLGPVIETMAAAEHLDAHKNAVSIRLKHIQNNK